MGTRGDTNIWHRRIQIIHSFKLEKVPALREGCAHRVPLLTKNLSLVDTCWQRKKPMFDNGLSLDIPQHKCHNTNDFNGIFVNIYVICLYFFLSYQYFTFFDFHFVGFFCLYFAVVS